MNPELRYESALFAKKQQLREVNPPIATEPPLPSILTPVLSESTRAAATIAEDHRRTFSGKISVVLAYAVFGLLPIYWKGFYRLAPEQVFFHRVFGSMLVLLFISLCKREFVSLLIKCTDVRTMKLLCFTAMMIGSNWCIYLWAIKDNQLMEASLGYFLCPLFSIGFGILLCGERMNCREGVAVACMLIGVAMKVITVGTIPWIALWLGLSFSLYSLTHQRMKLSAREGLLVETILLSPIAYALAQWRLPLETSLFFAADLHTNALLALAGPVTALPMLLLLHGGKATTMRFLGIAQYIAPTLSLAVAILLHGETFRSSDLFIFSFIWLGVGLFLRARQVKVSSSLRIRS